MIMADTTNIAWTDSTFNPWMGCTAVSPACDHCYAQTLVEGRFKRAEWGPGKPRVRTSAANWKLPLQWEREHEAFFREHGRNRRVFCASLADVFDNEVDPAWRADLLQLIKDTPHLTWQLLTKRIGNAERMLQEACDAMGTGMGVYAPSIFPNVWLGITVCNQQEADRDIPKLLAVPAAKRFLSIEPMLGAIDLRSCYLHRMTLCGECPSSDEGTPIDCPCADERIDWVIAGGESGKDARPSHPDWFRSLRDQCAAAGVPFFFKQWGEWLPRSACYHVNEHGKSLSDIDPGAKQWPCIRITRLGRNGRDLANAGDGGDVYMQMVGTKASGNLLDGVKHEAFPI